MKTQIAIALTASYAAATASQGACDGYYAGMISEGWECTFKDGFSTGCTNADGTDFTVVVSDGVIEWEEMCKNDDGSLLTMKQPTTVTCDKWKTDN